MREWLGLAALNVVLLGLGTSVLAALGIVRNRAAAARFAGLAIVAGWAALGIACSYALMAGARLSLAQILALALGLGLLGVLVAQRVPPRTHDRALRPQDRLERALAAGGGVVLVAYLEVLFLRARLGEPSRWDTWAFWIPKAKSIVLFDGLDTGPGGFTSFANPDYPPLKPAMDAVVFRFIGDADPGALPVQSWVLAVAFFGAVAALLADRVRPWILWPSLALVAVLPDFGLLIGSLLGDEPVALLFALAGVCGARWLLDRDVRFIALATLFLTAAALTKYDALMLTLVLVVLLGAVTKFRPWRSLLAAAALPLLAVQPWRLWMDAHDVAAGETFRIRTLVDPAYLLDRTDRLATALDELPPVLFTFDRWLLTVPLVLVAAAGVVARRPALATYVVGTVVLGVLGFATVYWANPWPLDWYIDTTADRIVSSLALFAAVLFPLLVSEALGAGYPDRSGARSSAVRAADS
jgi:hypothetical protein